MNHGCADPECLARHGPNGIQYIFMGVKKLNCWEFHNCGRAPGGENTGELGICPAALEIRTDTINEGKNGGRACWAVAGTLCQGVVDGKFNSKVATCMLCDFYTTVCYEQGRTFQGTAIILDLLRMSA